MWRIFGTLFMFGWVYDRFDVFIVEFSIKFPGSKFTQNIMKSRAKKNRLNLVKRTYSSKAMLTLPQKGNPACKSCTQYSLTHDLSIYLAALTLTEVHEQNFIRQTAIDVMKVWYPKCQSGKSILLFTLATHADAVKAAACFRFQKFFQRFI